MAKFKFDQERAYREAMGTEALERQTAAAASTKGCKCAKEMAQALRRQRGNHHYVGCPRYRP